MARPIEPIQPLTGKAARLMIEYLRNSRPDPKKAEQAARDREWVRRHIRPLLRNPRPVPAAWVQVTEGDQWLTPDCNHEGCVLVESTGGVLVIANCINCGAQWAPKEAPPC